MDFARAKKFFDALPQPEHWDLERMKRMVRASGLDVSRLNAVLVGGTNGKGSVCAFLESVLRAQGYSAGFYSSPHLLDVRERIRVDGVNVSKKDFVRLAEWVEPIALGFKASYFEALTLAALKLFLDEKVDWAVVEVGMGGRLDATNVLLPKIAAITNVSLEHTSELGSTIEQIAREKAGIIKSGEWAVVTGAGGRALTVMRRQARKEKVKLVKAKKKIKVKTKLGGEFQKENAAVAAGVLGVLRENGVEISPEAERKGFARAEWPGRFQRIGSVLVDGAHNPAGIKALLESLPAGRMNLVFGVLKDKDYEEMVRLLAERKWNRVLLAEPKTERALGLKELEETFKANAVRAEACKSVKEAVRKTGMAGKEKTIVCGSLFVAAEALKALGWEL